MLKSVILITVVLISAVAVATVIVTMVTSTSESYLQERDKLLVEEESRFFGKKLTLNDKETVVNKMLINEKVEELQSGYKNSSNFLPLQHFFQAKERIDKSRVFAFIRRIPKGTSLHTHLLAAVSADFIIRNITYRQHLYGGYVNGVFKLKFMRDPHQDDRSNWTSIQEMRHKQGAPLFDKWLREQLVLNVDNPRVEYPNAELVWSKFKKVFTTTYDLLAHKPIFQEYIHQLLQELYDDNVMYTELKGTIMPLYDLDGTTYTKENFFEIFIETVEQFKKKHPKFVGAKYIHSIYRGVDEQVLHTGLQEIIEMKRLFPSFIAGFDFVGYEEEGKSLLDYCSQLLEAQKELKFFFHAGETNWFGHTDLNLADAILLNSSRIGHGFALAKHPKLLSLGKERKIPLEICPISNQVLMLNEDPRNHPAASLMALDYPVVICNDDPSIWNATGLSYDWYVAFMAMTPRSGGLEILKQFALNSIVYSAMEDGEKEIAMQEWRRQWDQFLDDVVTHQ